jgi:hypothetical protein
MARDAFARCAGLPMIVLWTQGSRTRPWATRCRPLRGLASDPLVYPDLALHSKTIGREAAMLRYFFPISGWSEAF